MVGPTMQNFRAGKNRQKKIKNQETSLVNSGHLKVLKDTKLILNEYELPLHHLGFFFIIKSL